ncbi:PucR C-terminal helix-turn-helix domain-containing protein [Blastococcus aurantiacus]|uniref:PucR C-terminal helix-turn-helix domain-containing protein n=1 Tax=Blastococcus aurantiacus TaxID=1550231 RepID=A0A1G7HFR0_9ACTN|nr:helix-turn-helix domain-containing protein [Blastococcus aurantiacus]SDE99166.1 PucR C-terminal helix-turn-helix domain-containing protein [Blastococcus aurantiacus]
MPEPNECDRARPCAPRRPGDGAHPPVLAAIAAELLDADLTALAGEVSERLRAEEPAYRRLGAGELTTDVAAHLDATLDRLSRDRSTVPAGDAGCATVGRRRAEQNIPLPVALRGLRSAASVLWRELAARAAARTPAETTVFLEQSGALWTVLDEQSRALATGYDEGLTALTDADRERRRLLLDALVDGRLGEWSRLGGSLTRLGLPEEGPYVAVSAEQDAAGRPALAGAEDFLAGHGVRSAWRTTLDGTVGIVAIGEWRTVTSIRELLGTLATGRVGLSRSYADALQTSVAVARAMVARRCLPAGAVGVTAIDDDPVAALLASSVETSTEVSRLLLGAVMELPEPEQQTLLATLATWLATNGNSTETGRLLFCHRNTVRNRLARLEQLSGQSLEDPRSVARLFVAVEALRLLEPSVLGDAGSA